MEKLKRQRALLIQELRKTHNPQIQDDIKKEIDLIEQQMK